MSVAKQERPWKAGPELDTLEHAWWNENAELLARFWEMDESLSMLLRRHYLDDARAFFLNGREQVTVLELGCGSGWVGQALAGENLRIIGTDFSESQLDLARSSAEKKGLSEYVDYRLGSSDAWPAEAGSCDGVLIHSFLHHLDGSELEAFLNSLASVVRPGARIFLFEPAYLGSASAGGAKLKPNRVSKALTKLAGAFLKRVNASLPASTRDTDAEARFVALMEDANRKGWYLSPKEVPFEQEEFTSELAKRFQVESTYWAIINTVGWAFERNLHRPELGQEHSLWPWLVRIDRYLASDPGYLHSTLAKPAHAFHVWRCIKPENSAA